MNKITMSRQAVLCMMGAVLIGWEAVGSQAEERAVTAYWTEQPPTIDALGEDPCWKNVEPATGFTLFKTGNLSTNTTSFKVCYDAQNLYFLAVCGIEAGQKIKTEAREQRERDNAAVWNDDLLEVFLDPGRTRENFFHLGINAKEVIADESKRQGDIFNPDWRRAARMETNAWVVEMAIPFTQLVEADQFTGTPLPHERWGLNVCRNQNEPKEMSNWSLCHAGWHEPESFGALVFERGPGGPPVDMTSMDRGAEFYGDNVLRGEWVNAGSGPVEVKVNVEILKRDWDGSTVGVADQLWRDEKAQKQGSVILRQERSVTLEARGKQSFDIPYHISDGGLYTMKITAKGGERLWYAGKGVFKAPDVKNECQETLRQLDYVNASLGKMTNASSQAVTMIKEARDIQAKIGAFLKERNTLETMKDAAQWKQLYGVIHENQEIVRILYRKIILMVLLGGE